MVRGHRTVHHHRLRLLLCTWIDPGLARRHLGQNTLKAVPTGRGFDTYFGYWSGAEDYYTHDCRGAYDYNDDTTVGGQVCRTAFEYNNTYSTPTFTAKAVEAISNTAKMPGSPPMFLYMAYQNVHWPLEAPAEYLDMFAHVPDSARQHVCAMAKIMDDGIGNITRALKSTGMYDDTIIWFSSVSNISI